MRDAFMILLSELKLNNTPCSMGIVVTCPWWLERTRWVHTRTCTSQRNPTQPPLFLSSLKRCSPAASPPTPPPQTWWLICFYVLSHWCYPFFQIAIIVPDFGIIFLDIGIFYPDIGTHKILWLSSSNSSSDLVTVSCHVMWWTVLTLFVSFFVLLCDPDLVFLSLSLSFCVNLMLTLSCWRQRIESRTTAARTMASRSHEEKGSTTMITNKVLWPRNRSWKTKLSNTKISWKTSGR